METAQDLTSQTPAERWGELNRAILESALDCIITMDADGLVREFNPAAERVFGYRREDAVGQELANLIVPPALRERHRQGLAHYLKSGEGPVLGRRIEIAAVRADGTEILVELAITPLRISGRPMFTAYLRDITERVRSERRRTAQYSVASLLASSLSLREVGPQILQTIATSGDWVFGSIWAKREADAGLKCVATWRSEADGLEAFEKVTREMSLVGSSGLPGRVYASEEPLWIADVTTDPQFVRTEAARSANLHGAFAFPLCGESAASGVLELFSHNTVIPDEDLLQLVEALGSQIGLFVQRRQIQKELERQKEAAEAANAAKDQFLANLSHELRTPLTPVLIWAGAMAGDDTLPEDIREGLQMVCRNVELEARLIDDLLDLTRITRGKLQLNLRNSDGHELLRHAVEIVRSDIVARDLTLHVAFDATNGGVLVDPPRLQQVFWNVLRNAAKFTPAGGSVSVRTFNRTPSTFNVDITDTGIGIEPQFLDKIFDAFEQVASRGEGLGLGLAISKAVVEMHGGSIRATSPGPGKGATFAIELAMANAA
jgi:PAS domain S-box-containing protein